MMKVTLSCAHSLPDGAEISRPGSAAAGEWSGGASGRNAGSKLRRGTSLRPDGQASSHFSTQLSSALPDIAHTNPPSSHSR